MRHRRCTMDLTQSNKNGQWRRVCVGGACLPLALPLSSWLGQGHIKACMVRALPHEPSSAREPSPARALPLRALLCPRGAQAALHDALLAAQPPLLHDVEVGVLRWGRNAGVSPPRHVAAATYKKATALEVLVRCRVCTGPSWQGAYQSARGRSGHGLLAAHCHTGICRLANCTAR